MKRIHYRDFLNWHKNLKKTDNFLDIGCWQGNVMSRLKDKCHVYGMDIDRGKIKNANQDVKNRIKWGDVTDKIPFDKKFDYMLLSEVIEHVSDDEKLLENISDSLKEGGKLVLSTPHEVRFFEFWDPAWIKWKLKIGPVHRHYSIQKMRNIMARHKLEIEEYSVAFGMDFIWKRLVNIFLKYIIKSKKSLTYNNKDGFFDLCVIAKKIR